MAARRGDVLVDLVLCLTGTGGEATRVAHDNTIERPGGGSGSARDGVPVAEATGPTGCRCTCGRCRRSGGVDVRMMIPYTALLGAEDPPGELAGYGPIPAAVARDHYTDARTGDWLCDSSNRV
ncbi:MAG TPA: hypothetical protein VK784_15915 [Pseudonocardiaceae bacterium]|jgi:hypothetical protein|nr:hypothetical protein [Pseudonocardiaceae bacterium]